MGIENDLGKDSFEGLVVSRLVGLSFEVSRACQSKSPNLKTPIALPPSLLVLWFTHLPRAHIKTKGDTIDCI